MNTETTMEAPVAEAAQATPVADVAEVAQTEQTPEQVAEAAAAKARDDKGRFSKPPEERIAEVTRKMREKERESDYWRERATAREAKEAEAAKAATVTKPTADKFETYDAYIEALTEWKADQIVDTKLSKREAAAAEKAKAETRAKSWSERLDEATKAIPDYRDVMESAGDLRVLDHVADILQESESGGTLLYHLAKNPQLLDRVNGMTPTQAAHELGKFEASLERKTESPEEVAETPPPVAPRKTTNAPAPAKPLGSGRSTAVDLSKASMDEYKAARKSQGARWAR